MTINILGTEYTVTLATEQSEPRLEGCDGFCDETTREIVVENYKRSLPGSKGKLELQEQKTYVTKSCMRFCSKAAWLKTATGRKTKKW